MASDSPGPRRFHPALLALLVLVTAAVWWLALAKWYLNVCLPDPSARPASGFDPPAICLILE
jgi:hypothetical protein